MNENNIETLEILPETFFLGSIKGVNSAQEAAMYMVYMNVFTHYS